MVDQPLAEIETDKAIVELTAETRTATSGGCSLPEGDSVAVGDPILVMLADGEAETCTSTRHLPRQACRAVTPGICAAAPEPESGC